MSVNEEGAPGSKFSFTVSAALVCWLYRTRGRIRQITMDQGTNAASVERVRART